MILNGRTLSLSSFVSSCRTRFSSLKVSDLSSRVWQFCFQVISSALTSSSCKQNCSCLVLGFIYALKQDWEISRMAESKRHAENIGFTDTIRIGKFACDETRRCFKPFNSVHHKSESKLVVCPPFVWMHACVSETQRGQSCFVR